jgi:hypothetical protein
MSGSRWPSIGFCIAARTAGSTLLGPGPQSRRSGGLMGACSGVIAAIVPDRAREYHEESVV